MTDYYAEFTVVRRHIMQFEADSWEEAVAIVREGTPDEVDIQVLDSDKPVVLIHEFDENEDGPFMTSGSPFDPDRATWAAAIAKALPRVVAEEGTDG